MAGSFTLEHGTRMRTSSRQIFGGGHTPNHGLGQGVLGHIATDDFNPARIVASHTIVRHVANAQRNAAKHRAPVARRAEREREAFHASLRHEREGVST